MVDVVFPNVTTSTTKEFDKPSIMVAATTPYSPVRPERRSLSKYFSADVKSLLMTPPVKRQTSLLNTAGTKPIATPQSILKIHQLVRGSSGTAAKTSMAALTTDPSFLQTPPVSLLKSKMKKSAMATPGQSMQKTLRFHVPDSASPDEPEHLSEIGGNTPTPPSTPRGSTPDASPVLDSPRSVRDRSPTPEPSSPRLALKWDQVQIPDETHGGDIVVDEDIVFNTSRMTHDASVSLRRPDEGNIEMMESREVTTSSSDERTNSESRSVSRDMTPTADERLHDDSADDDSVVEVFSSGDSEMVAPYSEVPEVVRPDSSGDLYTELVEKAEFPVKPQSPVMDPVLPSAGEEKPLTPSREKKKKQKPSTPACQQESPATPPREQKPATPPREQKSATPTREQKSATPPREQKSATPTREQKLATPIRAQKSATPTREQKSASPPREHKSSGDRSSPLSSGAFMMKERSKTSSQGTPKVAAPKKEEPVPGPSFSFSDPLEVDSGENVFESPVPVKPFIFSPPLTRARQKRRSMERSFIGSPVSQTVTATAPKTPERIAMPPSTLLPSTQVTESPGLPMPESPIVKPAASPSAPPSSQRKGTRGRPRKIAEPQETILTLTPSTRRTSTLSDKSAAGMTLRSRSVKKPEALRKKPKSYKIGIEKPLSE